MKKITIVNFSDSRGGAAIACRQTVSTLINLGCLNVRFIVAEKKINDDFSEGPSRFQRTTHFLLRFICLLLSKLQFTKNNGKHSLNIFSSSCIIELLNEESDVVHFHWVNNETISIREISRVLSTNCFKKVVFTLHDEWFFLGSEHIGLSNCRRYIDGYKKINNLNLGMDFDRIIFAQKMKLVPFFTNREVIFTVPSRYMLEKAKNSLLLGASDIRLIPNIIDIETFRAQDKTFCRNSLGIDTKGFVLLFGAIGGGDSLKGSDLLLEVLKALDKSGYLDSISLVVFGGSKIGFHHVGGFKAYGLGHIHERETMSKVYSCADLSIVPSRRESFGQVAAESLSCQTPVVAFDNSGIADIVLHGQNGYLANAFDADIMAKLVIKFFTLSELERQDMGRHGRKFVEKNFSEQVVGSMLLELYKND